MGPSRPGDGRIHSWHLRARRDDMTNVPGRAGGSALLPRAAGRDGDHMDAAASRDIDVEVAVSRLLHEHPALSGQRINATVQDGVVWLTGSVQGTAYARAARCGARLVPGVVAVVDGLDLRPALRCVSSTSTRGPARRERAGT